MQMVVICEMFGWTYQQYKEQPVFFLDLIREKMKVDAQVQQNASKK